MPRYEKKGRPPLGDRKMVSTAVVLPPTLLAELRAEADAGCMRLSEYVRACLVRRKMRNVKTMRRELALAEAVKRAPFRTAILVWLGRWDDASVQ